MKCRALQQQVHDMEVCQFIYIAVCTARSAVDLMQVVDFTSLLHQVCENQT